MNCELSCDAKNMDKQCSTSTGQSSEVCDNSQEIPERCSLKENNSDYMCNLCNKSFAKENYLNNHIRIHVAKKPHSCQICSKSFTSKGGLNRHSLTHSGEKPHVCKICYKSFTLKCHLNGHLLTHSGVKPHICDICKKSFNQKEYLKRHSLTHSGKKPHVCNICNKSFTLKVRLNGHLLTHSGEKPYACDICKTSFTCKRSLKYHFFKHNGENPHICNICNKSFAHKGSLNRHLLIHCGKEDKKDSSIERREELSSTSEKNKNVNSDSHLAETSGNSHENNHTGKFYIKDEIDYIVKEEHDISDEEENNGLGIDEILIKSEVDLHEMFCDIKEEKYHYEVNNIVKEEHVTNYEVNIS